MKILYLHQYFKKPTMSGGVRSYEFARRLVNDGNQVVLISSDVNNVFKGWRVEYIDGIEVHWVSVPYNNKFGVLKRAFAFLKFMLMSTLHILSIKADVVIATSTPLTISVPALIYKLFRRKPFIFEVRDVWPEVPVALGFLKNSFVKFLAYKLESVTYKYSDHIVALSPDMKRSIVSRCGFDNVTTIPNASDVELFDIEKDFDDEFSCKLIKVKSKHSKVVFYTGTLGMVNNLSYIINLARHSEGDIAFAIIGDGKEREDLEELANRNATLNRVIYFFDSIPKNRLYKVHSIFDLSCSTVLPIPELYANSANKIFDAFASGTPILINHGGWISGLIEEKGCGIVLSHNADQHDFLTLRDFLLDDIRYASASASSRTLGLNDFNRDRLFIDFLKVIQDVVNYNN